MCNHVTQFKTHEVFDHLKWVIPALLGKRARVGKQGRELLGLSAHEVM